MNSSTRTDIVTATDTPHHHTQNPSTTTPGSDLSKKSTAWLLREYDRVTALARYQTNPLAFGREVFPHLFRLPTHAVWHEEAMGLMSGLRRETARVNQFTSSPLLSLPVGSSDTPTSPNPSHFSAENSPTTNDAPVTPTPTSTNDNHSTSTSPLHLALHAPRGHAKSTLGSQIVPIWHTVMNTKHLILLVSDTQTQAMRNLKVIKNEWETNHALRALCPSITPNKDKWTESEIELFHGKTVSHKIIALGSGHQLRGLRFLQWRPDLVVIDDGEDDEMVRSDLRRLTYQEWFDNVILKLDPQCDVVKIGTIIHEYSLLNRLIRQTNEADAHRYQNFTRRIFVALNDQGESTWPERESADELKFQRELNPYSFSQEKQGQPVDPSYCPFKAEFFTERRWWTQLPTALSISITIDPAWTVKDHSKETALICAGWDAQGRLWVLDEHHAKYDDPSLILDLILDWYLRWNKNEQVHPQQKFFCVGFDTISAQKMLMTSFRDRCRERELHPHLRELKADRDKIRRIWQLEPFFRHDKIFLRPDMTYLQSQLQGFPRNVQGGLVDCADALAYHLQLQQYRPDGDGEPVHLMPKAMSFDEYAHLHERTKAFYHAHPDWAGRLDPHLVAAWADGWMN